MDYAAAYGGGDDYNAENLYFYDDEAEGAVSFPTADRHDMIRIALDDLPNVQSLMDLLDTERVTLSYWLRLAVFYYKRERYDEFVELLKKSIEDNRPGNEKDRVRALDMLAAYYVQRGNQERTKDARRGWFDEAKLMYAMADRVSRYDQFHLIGRAHFCLLEGKTEQEADIQLEFVLKQLSPHSADERLFIPACMGKACIQYMRKDYKSSLDYFKKCLQANPNCPAFIRLGIGYCLVKLGKTDKAKIAFERCIELDPENIDAQAALAVLKMTSPQNDDEMRSGIFTLGNLYKREKDHPLILNHLANHFFIKSEIDDKADKTSLLSKTKKLLDHAIQVTKNEQSLAESNYHMARYFHAQGQFVDAHRHYYQACQFNHPKFVLPFYGYGQTSIIVRDYEKAIEAFEKVLKAQPNNAETLKILGALYARSSASDSLDKKVSDLRKQKSQEYLKKACEQAPNDVSIQLDLAVLLQRTDFLASLAVYEKIVEQSVKDGEELPPEISNNIGILHYRLKQYEKARTSFLQCREILVKSEPMDDKIKAQLIIVSFNLARVDEQLDKFGEAKRIYNGILKRRPTYFDARMRLACMSFNSGDMKTAMQACEQLNEHDPNNFDAWILHGNIYFEQNNLNEAQKKYEQVLKSGKVGSNDSLALVAMGNIWLSTLFLDTRSREKDQTHRDRAMSYYLKALRVNPNSVYAAHGAGCILAQSGETMYAYDVFGQVRENVSSDYPDVWLNIANISLEMGNFTQAAQIYQKYAHIFKSTARQLERVGSSNRVLINTFTAFAYYKANKFHEALDFCDRALIDEPTNMVSRYNHAFVSMKLASDKITDENSNLDDVKQSVEGLTAAYETFDLISKETTEKIQPYKYLSRTQCGELARQCSDLLRQSELFLGRAEEKQLKELTSREELENERLRVLAANRFKMVKEMEEKEILAEALKLRRRLFMQHNKDALRHRVIKDEPKQRSSGGGSKKRKKHDRRMDDSDGFVNDDEIVDKVHRKKNKALERKRDREFIYDSDDERNGKNTKRQSRQTEEDPARFKGKVKSRAIVEDSSSSSSSDEDKAKKKAKASSGDDSGDNNMDEQQRQMRASFKAVRDSDSDSDAEPSTSTVRKPKPKQKKKQQRKMAASSSESDESPRKQVIDSDEDGDTAQKSTPRKKKAILTDSDSSNNDGAGGAAEQSDNEVESPKKKNPFDSDSE